MAHANNKSRHLFITQIFTITAAFLLLTTTFSVQAQVNMNRRIDIKYNTTWGFYPSTPRLQLAADSMHTPIKIVMGTMDTTIFIDTLTSSFFDQRYNQSLFFINMSQCTDSFVYIYGDVTHFSSAGSMGEPLDYMDFSNNTALRTIVCDSNYMLDSVVIGNQPDLAFLSFCYTQVGSIDIADCPDLNHVRLHSNHFTTSAYDEVMCQLPQRQPSDSAKLTVGGFFNSNDNTTAFVNTNSLNALSKNWFVHEPGGNLWTTPTVGTYVCPPPTRRIHLKVRRGTNISMNFAADTSNSPIHIVSGNTDTIFTADTNFTMRSIVVPTDDTVMSLIGSVKVFHIYGYQNNVSEIDASRNPYLIDLECMNNDLTNLQVANYNLLQRLMIGHNNLSSLNINYCPRLTVLNCEHNDIPSLDIAHCPALQELYCGNNRLAALDIANNSQITTLSCEQNLLTSIDLANDTVINTLKCYGNSLGTRALDELMCALPATNGSFCPICNATDQNDLFFATNVANVISKGWSVFDTNSTPITATNGNYDCGQTQSITEANALNCIGLVPNPANGTVTIYGATVGMEIHIIDMLGNIVSSMRSNADQTTINIHNLKSGLYFVKTEYDCKKLIVR